MPQHKGFEPFAFIWVIQVELIEHVPFSTTDTFSYNKLFIAVTEQGYNDFKTSVAAQSTKSFSVFRRIVKDYGKQKWYNDKVWMQTQFNDMFVYGNFQPALLP